MGWEALKSASTGASAPMGFNPHLADAFVHSAGPNLSVRIHNLDEIGRVYGSGAALRASDHVETFLKYQLRGRDGFGLADYVLRQLSGNPVTYDGQRYHLIVSLAPTGDSKDCAHKVLPTVYGNPAFPDDAWCRQYRADMALAVTLFEAMADNRLVLAWQPVRNTGDPSQCLYHECLLRIVTPGGQVEPAGPAIEALERLGLVRALDHYVFGEVLAALNADPARRLGVNISAQSLVCDAWWARHLEDLAAQPWLCRRLFVEITETAPMASATAASDFISALRQRGCRIVLDDFGTGHAAFRLILALKPDIIKIDRYFVHHAAASAQGFDVLVHLIGLAESLGAIAIVEGVETESESEMVLRAGGCWQQGYHLGGPSFAHPSRYGGLSRNEEFSTARAVKQAARSSSKFVRTREIVGRRKPGDPQLAEIWVTGEEI